MSVQTGYTDYATATAGVAFPGLRADNDKGMLGVKAMFNADTVQIPFGAPVARYNTPGSMSAKMLATSGDIVAGVVMQSNAYSNAPGGDLGTTGLLPGAVMNVLRQGRIWVTCITGCAPGDRLYVSYAVGGPYTAIGQLGNATQASTTIAATTQGEWQTAAAAGAVAILEIDFLNKAG